MKIIDTLTPICFSGGAIGSDFVFAKNAYQNNHKVFNLSFEGHSLVKQLKGEVINISTDKLIKADKYLKEASILLNKYYSAGNTNYVNKLLQRNYFQVKTTKRIYAIVDEVVNNIPQGGTGWAITIGYILNVPEIYMYHQRERKWYQLKEIQNNYFIWTDVNVIPVPTGKYTGIGTRKISISGILAIENLYKRN